MSDYRSATLEFVYQLQNDPEPIQKRSIWVGMVELASTVVAGIRNLFSNQEIKHIEKHNQHLTVRFNELSKHQEILTKNQNYLAEQVKLISSKIHLSLYVDELISRINHNMEIVRKFTQALISLHAGNVPTYLFGGAEMESVFQELRTKAAISGLTLIVDTSVQLYGSQTSFFIENSTLNVWKHVQCYNQDEKFSLFERINLPFIQDGNSYEILDRYRFIGSTLGLTSDRELIILENLNNCKEFKSKLFLCPETVIWKNFESICSANLFLDNSLENCEVKSVVTKNRFTYTYDNSLILSFPKQEEVVELCKNEVHYSKLVGVTKYELGNDCILHTNDYYLRAHSNMHFTSNLTVKNLIITNEEKIKLKEMTFESENDFIETTYNHTEIDFEPFSYHDSAQYGLNAFIGILVFGLIIFLIIKSRRLAANSN